MTACRWTSSTTPRVLVGRHDVNATDERVDALPYHPEDCPGCLPCMERHCVICARVHVEVGVCPECIAATRDDLREIATLCDALPTETVHRGVNSEAAMLWGPTADPEAWNRRVVPVLMGRCRHRQTEDGWCPDDMPLSGGPTCAKCRHSSCTYIRGERYLCSDKVAIVEDNRDERAPLWVLGTWEQVYRDTLDQPTDLQATLPRLVDWLDRQLHHLAAMEEPPFEDFARDLRGCRAHLEDVLTDGERDERGAPCVQCGQNMSRVITDQGAQDVYECRTCRRTVTGNQYRYAVGVAYLAHAKHLTAPQIHQQYEVAEGSTRGWASKVTEDGEPAVRKRGKTEDGLVLYDVADVLAVRDGTRRAVRRDNWDWAS